MLNPIELVAIAGAAVLLFGAERLPKLARSAGEMRREFMKGQQEAELEHATAVKAATPDSTPTGVTPEPGPHVAPGSGVGDGEHRAS